MQQCARQLPDHFDGFLLSKRYLIHDRDSKFTEAFDQYLRDYGAEPVILPPQSPNRQGLYFILHLFGTIGYKVVPSDCLRSRFPCCLTGGFLSSGSYKHSPLSLYT